MICWLCETGTHRTIPDNEVVLTADEVERVKDHAAASQEAARRLRYPGRFDPLGGESRLDVDLRAYGAELAAHRVTGLALHWHIHQVGEPRRSKRADLGDRTEVRSTRNPAGMLRARPPHDPRWFAYLLVIGYLPRFRLVGWLEGIDLMTDRYRRQEPLGRVQWHWAAPQADLRPLPLPADA